jgi:hypothetical protein
VGRGGESGKGTAGEERRVARGRGSRGNVGRDMVSAIPALLVTLESSGLDLISRVYVESRHVCSAARPRRDWWRVLVDSAFKRLPWLPSRCV